MLDQGFFFLGGGGVRKEKNPVIATPVYMHM